MKFKQHPLSAAFPAMTDEEYGALVTDIEANGQRDPVVIHEGMVLDGWNRARACDQLAMPLRTTELPEGTDPVAFVLSRNLHRRHLTASQRAMAVAACATWIPHGGDRSQGAAAAPCAAPGEPAPKTLAALAEDAGVSRRTMAQAAKVVKRGAPEVAKAVKDGELPVERAAEIAALPPEEQQRAVANDAPPKAKERKQRQASAGDAEELRVQLQAANDAIEELSESLRNTVADNEGMARVFEADDKLAEAMKENAKLRAEVSGLRERVNGLLNEKNEQIRLVKHWRGRAEKAEKALA